jgi:hypothetical protein
MNGRRLARVLLVGIGCVAATHTAVAQDVRTLQIERRLQTPATFKTESCPGRIVVENSDATSTASVSRDIFVVIDKRYRVYVGAVGRVEGRRYSLTFTPHDFLCDGKAHRVELSWKGARRTSYEMTFRSSSTVGVPVTLPPLDGLRPYQR